MTRSNWWFALPLLFGFIGGVVGFFAIKNGDKEKAVNLLIVGVLITIIQIVLNFGFMLTLFAGL